MRIDQIKSFCSIANCLSFSEAADRLFMSQSALSKHILAMEKELEILLIERSSRKVVLTPAGQRALIHMKNIVYEYDLLSTRLKDYSNKSMNKICITVLHDLRSYGLADMIVSFEMKHTSIHIETLETTHDAMRKNLDNGISYCAIGFQEFWSDAASYHIIPLFYDPLVLVCSKHHALVKKGNVTLRDVSDEQFCFSKEDRRIFDHFLGLCEDCGFMPRISLSNVLLSTICEYIRHGLRLTITTLSRAKQYFSTDSFHYLPILGIEPLTMSVITKSSTLMPIYEEFIEYALAFRRDNGSLSSGQDCLSSTYS